MNRAVTAVVHIGFQARIHIPFIAATLEP